MQMRGISHSGDQIVSVHFFIKVVKIKHLMPHNKPLTFSDMLNRILSPVFCLKPLNQDFYDSFFLGLLQTYLTGIKTRSNIFP